MKSTTIAVLALAAGLAQAQDTIATAIPGVAAAGTKIELIKEGFDGTEGPLALADGSLIFTETTANRITRIGADGTTSTYLDNSNGSNGLGFGPGGALYAVQVREPRVGIVAPKD
jgi:gluconolactonase